MLLGISQSLVGALLLSLAGLASAQTPVDIYTNGGVPGTGGNTVIQGPCYCTQQAFFSPVMLLQPGVYDFGNLRDYWVESNPTPDGGPNQANLYLLFSPIFLTGTYPNGFPSEPSGAYPANSFLCGQTDGACNAHFQNAYEDLSLVYAIPAGQDAAQIGLVGKYTYTAPVPEPGTYLLVILGLAFIIGTSRTLRRGDEANARFQAFPAGTRETWTPSWLSVIFQMNR
jgi:hypothetical protein